MNFLAHQVLSFNQKGIHIGNFIADMMKGHNLCDFSFELVKGIKLHRFIDEYTDKHPIVKEIKKALYIHHGRYTSVLVDVYFDYFLSKNWSLYMDEEIEVFSVKCYQYFSEYYTELPINVQKRLPSVIQEDWLSNYQYYEGLNYALQSVARRAKFENNIKDSLDTLKLHEEYINKQFLAFFPDLWKASKEKLADLNQAPLDAFCENHKV